MAELEGSGQQDANEPMKDWGKIIISLRALLECAHCAEDKERVEEAIKVYNAYCRFTGDLGPEMAERLLYLAVMGVIVEIKKAKDLTKDNNLRRLAVDEIKLLKDDYLFPMLKRQLPDAEEDQLRMIVDVY